MVWEVNNWSKCSSQCEWSCSTGWLCVAARLHRLSYEERGLEATARCQQRGLSFFPSWLGAPQPPQRCLRYFLCFLSLQPLFRDTIPEREGWTCPLTAVAGSQPCPAASPPSRDSHEVGGLAVLRENALPQVLPTLLPVTLPGGSALTSERDMAPFPALSPHHGRGHCLPRLLLSGGSAEGCGCALRTALPGMQALAQPSL